MPRLDKATPEKKLAKLLLVADGKVGKSHYAGVAAKHFNMLYLDGDVAIQTLSKLPAEIQRNIYLLSVGDTIEGGRIDSSFQAFVTEFFTSGKILWDDTNHKIARARDDLSESEIWEIQPGRLDHNTILVLDSWTTLCMSMAQWAADANGVDLTDTSTPEMRPVYQATHNKATQFLRIIEALPCHVIAIAHPEEFVKMEKPSGSKVKQVSEGDQKILWTKMVPKSTSRNHSLTMSKHFTDVAWLESNATGSRRYINFRISDERISGGHFNDRVDSEERGFIDLIRAVGGHVPDSPPEEKPWLTIHEKGMWQPNAGKVLGSGKTDSSIKIGGNKSMTSLFAKKENA